MPDDDSQILAGVGDEEVVETEDGVLGEVDDLEIEEGEEDLDTGDFDEEFES